MISPKGSQAFGLTVSTVTGLAVFAVVWGFFVWKLDFWYLDKVLGPVFGFISGCLSAYAIYTTGMRDVPLNWVGVGLFLGKPDDTLYENGIQWVSPFGDIITVTPTPVVAVATPANVGGSNKSTPTPKVGVPADVKKWLRLAMVAVTIVICITLIASVARSPDKQTEKATVLMPNATVPLASSPQSEWPKLVIPAGGKSERIVYTHHMQGIRLVILGNNYRVHNIYPDGRECVSGDMCPDGAQLGAYLTSTTMEVNKVLYAFAPN